MESCLEFEESKEDITCPLCNGKPLQLGYLGTKEWFKCQDCGIEFCKEEE